MIEKKDGKTEIDPASEGQRPFDSDIIILGIDRRENDHACIMGLQYYAAGGGGASSDGGKQ